MARINFKVTSWEGVNIPDEHLDEVLTALENGYILTSNDLVEFVDNLDGHSEYEMIPESETQLTVEENGGDATIEVIGESFRLIWTNKP
jgi:hypothetical protein